MDRLAAGIAEVDVVPPQRPCFLGPHPGAQGQNHVGVGPRPGRSRGGGHRAGLGRGHAATRPALSTGRFAWAREERTATEVATLATRYGAGTSSSPKGA